MANLYIHISIHLTGEFDRGNNSCITNTHALSVACDDKKYSKSEKEA